MKQSISQRLNGVVAAKIKSIAINQPHETDVTATFAPTLNEQGAIIRFDHHWLVTVSIPNPLQGNVDIAVSMPIGGVLPPDIIFEKLAEQLFEYCMTQKQNVLKPPEPEPAMQAPMPGGRVHPVHPVVKGEVTESKTETPRKPRERNTSFFPSKPGSGEFSAD